MKTKGRKLFRGMLGALAAVVLMGVAYTTTVMASSIGMIDTADLLDIHAEADAGSEVVGQVMDEGHVAILTKGDGWVQIQAGNIIGWVPADNLIEKEISNEEAVAANEEVIGRQAKELEQDNIEAETQEEQAEAQEEQTEVQTETLESVQDMTAAEDVADAEAFAREVAVSVQKADLDKAQEEAAKRAAREAEELIKAQAEAAERAQKEAAAIIKVQQEAAARAAAEAAAQAEAQLRAQQEEAARAAAAAAQAEAEKAAEAARRQAILSANGITEEDLYLLANIIYCEAGCEPYIGKVAVGNVVMNRVKSNRQPNTIQGVVYAKGQFSPVRNGSLERALRRSSADESCYQAALEALSGAKPVGDKLFFRRVNGRPGQVIG
ncbi:MAG: cell wall hydrolase, partial [Eisenbergiella sp.]